jgi:hypothetical protein
VGGTTGRREGRGEETAMGGEYDRSTLYMWHENSIMKKRIV